MNHRAKAQFENGWIFRKNLNHFDDDNYNLI